MVRIQYNVKIDKKDIELMKKITSLRGDDASDFIRFSIKREFCRLGYLTNDEKKALEFDK